MSSHLLSRVLLTVSNYYTCFQHCLYSKPLSSQGGSAMYKQLLNHFVLRFKDLPITFSIRHDSLSSAVKASDSSGFLPSFSHIFHPSRPCELLSDRQELCAQGFSLLYLSTRYSLFLEFYFFHGHTYYIHIHVYACVCTHL